MTTKTKTRIRPTRSTASNLQSRAALRPRRRRRKQSKSNPNRNLDQISISRALRVSNDDSIVSDRVAVNAHTDDDDTHPCSSANGDELGLVSRFSSSKDMVWAKAYSDKWLPGLIRSEHEGTVLVSFFGCKRSAWVSESQTRSFEDDFELMLGKEVGKKLDSGAIECALEEFGRRLTWELSCSCQDTMEDGDHLDELEARGKIDVNEVFKPLEAARYAREIAVSQMFDEIDALSVSRAAAQLNAFRRFAFIKQDWIYEQTMRLSEASDDSEDEMMSTCFEDETARLVTQDVEFENEELEDFVVDSDKDKEELGGEEENEEGDDNECVEQDKSFIGIGGMCFKNFKDERTSVISNDVGFENEELKDCVIDGDKDKEELEEENAEDADNECVEHDETFIGIGDMCFEDFKDKRRTSVMSNDVDENGEGECVEKVKSTEQEFMIRKSQIRRVFNPVEVLAFVQKMALSTWADDADNLGVIRAAACVKKFRRHTFIRHDWIYHETMRLSDDTNESDGSMDDSTPGASVPHLPSPGNPLIGTYSIHEKIQKANVSDDGENSHNQFVRSVESGSTICKTTVEESPHDILKHLYCLARDPFSGSKRHGVRNYNYICKKILRYRYQLYEKVTDFSQNIECTSCDGCVAEISEVQNCMKARPTTNLTKYEGKDFDSRINDKDVVEPVHRDLGLARGSNNCNGDFESDKVQKIRETKVMSRSCNVEEGREIVDHQRDILVCNQKNEDMIVYKMNNTRHIVDVNTCHSTSIAHGRDMINIQWDIPACGGEYKRSKREETISGKGCTSNKRQRNMDAVVRCGLNNVEGVNIIGPESDIPQCNDEYKSNKRQKTEDINLFRTSKVKSENVFNSGRVNKKHKPDDVKVHKNIHNYHFVSNKCQEISASDSVLDLQGQSTEALPVGISASAIIDVDESKTTSDVLKGHFKSKHWNEACSNSRNVNLKDDCKSSGMISTLTGETKSQETSEALVRGGFPSSQRPSSSHLSHNSIDLHSSSGYDADIINKELNVRIVSEGCPEVNKSQHTVDISVKLQQPKTLLPLTMLYSSPLSAASPATSGFQCKSSKPPTITSGFQCKSSTPPTHSDNPTTLHMKFPRDFKLPSKEDLVNKFRPFGPIDHLKTKIFFYTGSAQIVFLHCLDAESACHHAKRNNIFLGEANVRFWIDQHEHSRRGTNKTSAPVSLLTPASSIPNVKPCLKISKGINSERKHLHVKFPSSNQDFQSDTVETCSDITKCGKEVGPNISQQMSVLLEKCDKTVNEIKNTLGLQSFYSLFTQIP